MFTDSLKKIISGSNLSPEEAREAMTDIMSGQAGEIRTAGFLTALSCKRETGEEIQAFARSMRKAAMPWPGEEPSILGDTCGTGGDSSSTLNISTLSGILLASLGIKIAKHGNRAVSSKSGSADLLERMGIRLDLESGEVASCLDRIGICFLFAQKWHPAMKFAGPVRKALGVRTVFNLLGPLTNPAPVTHQVLGIYDPSFMEPMAQALAGLGRKGAYVVHAEDGLDEVSPAAPTRFTRIEEGKITDTGTLSPEDFGFTKTSLDSLRIADVEEAFTRSMKIIAGEGTAEENAVICMNAALLYSLARGEKDLKAAAAACLDGLKSGQAQKLVRSWQALYNENSDSVVSMGHRS